ncbi:MAG: quinone oxidoreductase family protein [Solirubrobacteraceae bacterium]
MASSPAEPPDTGGAPRAADARSGAERPAGLMRAARVHSFGTLPTLDSVLIPSPRPGELLVRVLATVVTHLDLTILGGDFAIRPDLPHTPGLEAVGEVVAGWESPAGAQSPAGDQAPAGDQPPSLVQLDGCVGLDRPGAWAQYVAAPADRLIRLDPHADPLAELARRSPLATARDALFGAGAYRAWQRVAITGASGACGMLTVALAHQLRGAGEVIACVRDPARLALLPQGVTGLVDSPTAPAAPSEPVDLLVDYVGGADLARRLRWLRPGGRAVLVGYTAGTSVTLDIPNLLAAGISVVAFNGLVTPPASLPRGPTPKLPHVPYELVDFDRIVEACERLPRGGLSGRLIAVVDRGLAARR